jgi:hypothetical protein
MTVKPLHIDLLKVAAGLFSTGRRVPGHLEIAGSGRCLVCILSEKISAIGSAIKSIKLKDSFRKAERVSPSGRVSAFVNSIFSVIDLPARRFEGKV